jgi:acetylornithine deacetylase
MTVNSTSSARDAKRYLEPFREDLIVLTQMLVRTNSVALPPDGNETAGQLVLRDFLMAKGIQPELYETEFVRTSSHRYAKPDRNYAGRKNLIARLGGSGRGSSLLLNGHMDTVTPAKAGWSNSPWSGERKDGFLYGLGSFDMKAGVAAHAVVVSAVHAAGIRLGGDLLFESVVDEEWGGGGGTLAARLRGDTADACVISEGTQLDLFRATRGGYVVDLVAEAGDPNAYFSRAEVLSPAVALGRLLGWVETWMKKRSALPSRGAYADFADPAPVQVLAVESNRLDTDVPLSTPLRGAVRLYFQFLPNEDVPGVLRDIRESLDQFQTSDAFFRDHPLQWKPLVSPPLLGHELSEDHPWTRCLARNAEASLGRPAHVTAAPFPCDAFLAQREFNIPTLLFGPKGGGAHNANEHVNEASIFETAEVLLSAALEWCGA